MTTTEKQIGRMKAVLHASEEVIERANEHRDRNTLLMAKETAYDHFKAILEDADFCPWAE